MRNVAVGEENADTIEHVDLGHAIAAVPRTEASLDVAADRVEAIDDVRLRGLGPAVNVAHTDACFVKLHLLDAPIGGCESPEQRVTRLPGKVVNQPRLAEASWEHGEQLGHGDAARLR